MKRLLLTTTALLSLATPAFAEKARSESIYKAQKFSDHAPITIEYEGLL